MRRKIVLWVGALLLGLLVLILINSSLGVDSDETYTDLHRPQIVGEQANYE
ncbi:MAG: hypothetical protein OXI03_09840 [Chloroflexota bacterium]|nr:hypothetical protein [Chloroflexota bacterium]